jgi:hypothetical protein
MDLTIPEKKSEFKTLLSRSTNLRTVLYRKYFTGVNCAKQSPLNFFKRVLSASKKLKHPFFCC